MRLRWKVAQYFEIRWWRRYTSGMDKDEYLCKKKVYWQRVLDQCAEFFTIGKGDTLIDVGCGPSGVYMVFPENKVTAVDPLLDRYAAELPIFSFCDHSNVRFITSTVEELVTDSTYDYVFCMNAINHVSDIRAGFSVLARLAAPGAKLVVGIDAHNHSFLKWLFRSLHFDILHPHQYDVADYRDMIENEGCSVLTTIVLKRNNIFNYVLFVATKR